MVTGPAAFENFRRLMQALLSAPKEKSVGAKPPTRRKSRAKSS